MCRKLSYLVPFVLVLSFALTGTTKAELVGWWRFDEGSGTTAVDFSGNGNDGTLENAGAMGWEGGMNGMALRFEDGGYVSVGPGPWSSISTQFTIALWAFGSDMIGDNWGFYAGDAAGRLAGCHIAWGGSVYFDTTSGWERIDKAAAENEYKGQWRHWTFLKNADTGVKEIYLDGVLWHSGTGFTEAIAEVDRFFIGAGDNGANPYTGLIDDFRLYDHALSGVEILGAMAGEPWPYAFGPVPKDGAYLEDTWVSMSWSPGDLALSHDVYIGDNFDDVNAGAEGAFRGNQSSTNIVIGFPGFPYPDGLVPGTTYYWRIDEVNDAEPNSPWKGPVWSFMIPPKTAYLPEPADGAESVDPDVQLSWMAGFGAKLHHVYFGENFDEVDNAVGGLPQGATTYTPGTLKMAKTYYWRVDEFDVVETHKGDIWSFTTEGAVESLDPANGAVDVTQTPILTWTPGFGASHEVYFGSDKDAVKNADTSSPEYKGSDNLGSESYDPVQLEWNTTYYWRVDEANSTNADSPWTGPLWNFTTANFLIIDDFEAYNDLDPADPASNRIFNAWLDGFDNPAINGSVVGHANPPFAEQTIVHSGNQSMPMTYDNAVGKSEATSVLTSNRDWTVKGVNTLTIWFRGESANAAENLYVALNGNAVVNNDNPDAALETSWTEWNVDLQAFADQGVNLANVNSITLGVGNKNNPVAGGSGMMYFDDIRLYAPAP